MAGPRRNGNRKKRTGHALLTCSVLSADSVLDSVIRDLFSGLRRNQKFLLKFGLNIFRYLILS